MLECSIQLDTVLELQWLYPKSHTSLPTCTHPYAHTDIRELVQVDDVMEDEDLKLGPNGGLIFCME